MDAYDIMFGQLEPEELKKVNRSRNYGQAINLPAKEVYEGFDEVEQTFGERKASMAAKGHDPFVNFNPDADDKTDPFTGATARSYAELLYPAAKAATKGTAESLMSGAYIAAGHMGLQMLDVLKYIGSKGAPQGVISTALPDMEGTDVFPIAKRMFENTVKRGEEFKKWSQEDGVGPIAQFLAETAGSAPAGIAEFMLNMPFYGAKGGMKAEQKGDNEFIGFLKGALERNLMGRVLHSAAALNRPTRMAVTGAVFEEQARLGEGVSDLEELMKAFLTGGIFGTMGGKGKISTHDLRKELGNLEMEARERVRILGEMAPGDIMPGERGSATGNYLTGKVKGDEYIDNTLKEATGDTAKEWAKKYAPDMGPGEPGHFDLAFKWLSKYVELAHGSISNRSLTELKSQSIHVLNKAIETKNLPYGMGEGIELKDLEMIKSTLETETDPSKVKIAIDKMAAMQHKTGNILDLAYYLEYSGDIDPVRAVLDKLATGNKAGEPELTMTRAIRVGKKTYPVEEGSDHGKTYENIPTSELVKAGTDLQTGWTDQKGKFYTRQEVPWEKTTNMRDLTSGEKEKMGEGRAGDEISTDPLKGNVPTFKNSEEAVFFGGKATPEQVTQLKAALEKGDADVAARKDAAFEAMKAGDLGPTNALMKDAQKNAFLREAIAASEGAPRHGGGGVTIEKATLSEFESNPPKGYQVKTLPGEDIARAESDGTISLDPNKFFGHGEKERVDIIAHEKAHFLEEKIPPDVKASLFDNQEVMGYRGRNINEKLANMIQDGKLPNDLKPYIEGPGGAGEGGKPAGGGEGGTPPGGGPPPDKPKQYTKVLFTKKGSDRQIDPQGKELLNDIVDIEVGIEGETGKAAVTKRYLWEMTKEEGEAILKRGGLDPTLHELAIEKAMLQGKKVPLEAMRGYFAEGDLNAAEGISGIFAMKEHEMEVWLGQKSDAAIIYNYTNKMLTKTQKADIKRQVREVTGQANASEILSFPESTLLKNQIIMEVKASREAMNKGLKEGAAVASGRLHLAIEMARARADAKAEINYMIKEIKTVNPKKMTANTSDEVTRILAGLDLQKMSAAKRAKLERTQDYVTRGGEAELDYEVDSFVGLDTRVSVDKTLDYLSKSENTELPDYVLDDLARLNKTPIRDLSYQEIQSIHKSVMSLAAQSDRIQNLVVKLRDMKAEEASKQAVKEMKDPDGVVRDIISTRPTMMDKFKGLGHWIKVNLGLRQDSYDLIVETIAGPNGVAHDVLYRNPKRGILVQKQSQQKAESAFRDSLQKDGFHKTIKNPDKWMDERVKVGKWELSRGERMSLYMHSLNADNRRAILESGVGFKNPPPSSGLTPNKVVRITEKELDAISDSLTPEERMMTKAATAMFKEQGVDLANEFYRLNRYRMPPQDNYYPKDTMPLRRGGLDLETEEGMEAFRQFTARVGIDKTMLIERVGSTKPIYLNDLMTDVNRSVRKATAYIGLEDSMRNASRLLYDSNFKREMVDRYGRDTWVELEKGLKDIAGSYKSWTSFEKGVARLKTTTVSSALSINPWVWLNQPFSLINYWSYIEPRYLTKGLVDSMVHPKDSLDGLRMYSPELIDRLKSGYDRDVAAVYAAERDKSFYKGKSTLQEKGITPTKYFDLTAVVPGMKAAVYKALDEFKTGKLSRPVEQALNVTGEEAMNWTPEQKVAKAHEFADWVTQRTQAQSTMEHRSPLSRGTTLEQMFTAFTSQTNVMLGLARRTYRDYQRTKDPEAFRSMVKAWTSVFILNAGFMMGIDRLRDLVYGRDSKSLVAGFIDNAASLLYFVRDIEKTASSFIQEGHRGRESTIPATRFMEVTKDVATHINGLYSENEQVVEESYLGIVDGMAQMGAIYTGLPYQTPKRLLQAATGNNPPPKEGKEEDSSFFDGLMED